MPNTQKHKTQTESKEHVMQPLSASVEVGTFGAHVFDSIQIDKAVSDRIQVLRYAMILGIVALHMPPYQSLAELGAGWFDVVKGFFSHGVFRATTPMLTAMAGFLLFRSGMDLKPAKLLRGKSRTLLVPLIVFNVPLVLALACIQAYTGGVAGFRVDLTTGDPMAWANAVIGLFDAPVNYPTNFLRDLFVLCLLAPQLGMLLRGAPWTGLAVVMLIGLNGLDGKIILRDTMLINFYVGGMAAVLVRDLRAWDRCGHACLVVFLVWCAAITAFDLANRTVFVLCAPLLLWPAMSVMMDTAPARWLGRNAGASFFTFLTHGPLLVVAWWAWRQVTGDRYAEAAWFVVPVVVTSGCLMAYRIVRKSAPWLLDRFAGGR